MLPAAKGIRQEMNGRESGGTTFRYFPQSVRRKSGIQYTEGLTSVVANRGVMGAPMAEERTISQLPSDVDVDT